jgi:predicted P-loop ATPase
MMCKTLHRKLNQRRTDNTMTKRKRRSNDLQNNTQKTKSKKDRHYNDQKKKEKQWYAKHYTEN